jgi:hypothetical protein
MDIMTNVRKGIHVAKDDVTLDAMQQAIPHWIMTHVKMIAL